MKIIRKNQTKEFKNSANCTAIEYPMDDKDINGAVIELTGRYPEKDRVMNLECKELSYVLSGSGRIVIEEEEITLNQGDLILIEVGEKYFYEGNLTLFIACSPAWRPEQHKIVE